MPDRAKVVRGRTTGSKAHGLVGWDTTQVVLPEEVDLAGDLPCGIPVLVLPIKDGSVGEFKENAASQLRDLADSLGCGCSDCEEGVYCDFGTEAAEDMEMLFNLATAISNLLTAAKEPKP